MKCIKVNCNKEHDGLFGSGKYCSRACANSRVHSTETKLKIALSAKNSDKVKIANKINGSKLKKVFNGKVIPKIINICPICKKEILTNINRNKKYHPICYLSIAGGAREGSGHSKCGWYKGIYCGSSWELAWVIYHIDHNINFKRCDKKYEYIYNNKTHQYSPDFVLNNTIVEIKGYKTEKDIYKWLAIKEPFIVLYKEDMKLYINYVVNKYGKNFIDLYKSRR
jgi:hypothetical protein